MITFSEFIDFDKNTVSDRLYRYATLFEALVTEREDYETELKLKKLEVDNVVASQRILKRSKLKHVSTSKQLTATEINDAVTVIPEVTELKKAIIEIEDDLNRVKAEIEIMKETRKNLEILANDNREERKGSSMTNRKGGHS